MDRVVASFRNSIPKVLGLVALGGIMTAASAAVVLLRTSASFELWIGGYVGLVFFGLITLMFVSWLFWTGPVIEVSAAGIRYGRWRKEFIAWEAIDAIAGQKVPFHEMLILWLRPQSPEGRAVRRSIIMSGLDSSLSDLLDAIRVAQSYSLDGTSADRIGARHG